MKRAFITLIALAAIGLLVFFILGRGNSAAHSPFRLMQIAHLSKDAISVVKSGGVTKSYFGGVPPKSAQYAWPTRNGRPLSFLACIDCTELPRSADLDWLPVSGLLLFFYDLQEQPWGFDPKDRGGATVVYLPASEVPDMSSFASPPMALPGDSVVPRRYVAFRLSKMPPSWETPEVNSLRLTETELDHFMEQREALYGEEPHHQIGGFPDPVQNPEMDEECQLVTHGLYCGDATGYNDPRAATIRKGSEDWSLDSRGKCDRMRDEIQANGFAGEM